MTLREAAAQASLHVTRRDAEQLLLHVLGRDRPWLLAHPEFLLCDDEQARFSALVNRRAQHEPLQYLLGHQEFYGLDLRVTPAVLIPRPETELLVEAVLGWARVQKSLTALIPEQAKPLRIVDIGTGSGAIALALATHLPEAWLTATDLSPAALAVAQENGVRLGLLGASSPGQSQSSSGQAAEPQAGRIHLVEANLLDTSALAARPSGGWDVVVSNPPYIPSGDAPGLQPEVRAFEPHLALFAGEDGLELYRRLIPQALANLRRGGLLALEFGYGQQAGMAALLEDWQAVEFLHDLAGIPRVALAVRP